MTGRAGGAHSFASHRCVLVRGNTRWTERTRENHTAVHCIYFVCRVYAAGIAPHSGRTSTSATKPATNDCTRLLALLLKSGALLDCRMAGWPVWLGSFCWCCCRRCSGSCSARFSANDLPRLSDGRAQRREQQGNGGQTRKKASPSLSFLVLSGRFPKVRAILHMHGKMM